jgi:hypothetical protein
MDLKWYAAAAAWLASSGFAADAPQPVAVLPIQLNASGQQFIQARINGSEPIRCNVDSGGGDRVYLDRDRALQMGIQPTGGGRSAGPNDTKMAQDLRGSATVEAGGVKLPPQQVLLQSRPYADFSCVIGQTVFRDYVVEVDYQAPAIRLYDPARFRYEGPGKALGLVMESGNPFVDATLVTTTGKSYVARVAVDTGGGPALLMLSRAFADKNQVMGELQNPIPVPQFGRAGDQARVVSARFERLTVGPFEIAKPEIQLWQIGGFGGSGGPDGLLCNGFLQRFKLIFDYGRKVLVLEPSVAP